MERKKEERPEIREIENKKEISETNSDFCGGKKKATGEVRRVQVQRPGNCKKAVWGEVDGQQGAKEGEKGPDFQWGI